MLRRLSGLRYAIGIFVYISGCGSSAPHVSPGQAPPPLHPDEALSQLNEKFSPPVVQQISVMNTMNSTKSYALTQGDIQTLSDAGLINGDDAAALQAYIKVQH